MRLLELPIAKLGRYSRRDSITTIDHDAFEAKLREEYRGVRLAMFGRGEVPMSFDVYFAQRAVELALREEE